MKTTLPILLISSLLAACNPPDYPSKWPGPDADLLSGSKGDCPDLTGACDGVRSELSWLLSANPDFEKSQST
jgi:hypothetical protein